MKLYTIGHSNHPLNKFLSLLATHGIAMLVDVRSVPYSRFNPQYNQRNLQKALPEHGIEVVCKGDSLGGRPSDPTCYIHAAIPAKTKDYAHEIDYLEVMKRPWFIQGIGQLLDLADQQATCILCSEFDPALCHRQHLIAEYLMRHHPDVSVLHILRDGALLDAREIRALGDDPDPKQLSF